MAFTEQNPGFTGWGLEIDTPTLTLFNELRHVEKSQSEAPLLFTPQEPKRAEPRTLTLIKELLHKDGYEPGSMDLRYAAQLAFGNIPKFLAQICGSCVASGAMRAAAYRMLWEILVLGEPEILFGKDIFGFNSIAPFGPYHYGWGRKLGNMRGGDGSYCDVQIRALEQYGMLPCYTKALQNIVGSGERDYPEPQNSSLYRAFGNWKYIEELAQYAKPFLLKESELVTSAERSRELICDHFKPMMVCSNWGFAPQSQHPDGFWIYKRSGNWAHNMTKIAYRVCSRGDWWLGVLNSWGPNAHKDGEIFWIPMELEDRWLPNSVCRSIGNIDMMDVSDLVLFATAS